MGARRASHLKMGTGMGDALNGGTESSPSGQAKASVRWCSIWWMVIDPHKPWSVGLTRVIRERIAARSSAEDNIFINEAAGGKFCGAPGRTQEVRPREALG